MKNGKQKKKKKSRPPDWLFWESPGGQETLFFLLKDGLRSISISLTSGWQRPTEMHGSGICPNRTSLPSASPPTPRTIILERFRYVHGNVNVYVTLFTGSRPRWALKKRFRFPGKRDYTKCNLLHTNLCNYTLVIK